MIFKEVYHDMISQGSYGKYKLRYSIHIDTIIKLPMVVLNIHIA